MSDKVKERIEKELYRHIDNFTGNREVHTPLLVNTILKMVEAERPKAWNEAIDECRYAVALWLTEPEKLGSALMDKLEKLKHKQS